MSERGEGRNGSGHDLSASRASVGCLSCQGVFDRSLSVFFCVKVLLRAWSEEEMVSWPDLFLQLLSAIIFHSHDRLSVISVISLRHLCCHAFRLKLAYRSS